MTFFDIIRSQVIILEENALLFNKAQSEKEFYAFYAIFRVDVKPFQKITGRLPADHFHDPQSLPRIFKTKETVVDSKFAFLTIFHSLLWRLGCGAYQHDYVMGNYIELVVI